MNPKVTLLNYTPNPEQTVAMAAKLCYSPSAIENIRDGLTEEKTVSFVEMLGEIGHASPIEHASFTFGIEGVSRSFLAEIFIKAMQDDQRQYDELTEILSAQAYEEMIKDGKTEQEARRLSKKKAIEDARFVLPNACCTKMVCTFNARSLQNFFAHRCCNRAQWEIRSVAEQMLKLCMEVAPNLFKKCGPPCLFGKCPEGKMSCNKQKEVREKYGRG